MTELQLQYNEAAQHAAVVLEMVASGSLPLRSPVVEDAVSSFRASSDRLVESNQQLIGSGHD